MNSKMVDIMGLDKAEVLVALWNNSCEVGLSFNPSGKPLTVREARRIINGRYYNFDYCKGRVIKCNISGDEFDPWRYDRENGAGAAQMAIDELRKEIANRTEEKGTIGMMKQFFEFLNGSSMRKEKTENRRSRRRR